MWWKGWYINIIIFINRFEVKLDDFLPVILIVICLVALVLT